MPWASKKSAGDGSGLVMAEVGVTEGKAKFVEKEIDGQSFILSIFSEWRNWSIRHTNVVCQYF